MPFSPDYNFMSCVKTAQAAAVGCRPGWEDWSESDLPACTSLEQLRQHELLDWGIFNYELKVGKNSDSEQGFL